MKQIRFLVLLAALLLTVSVVWVAAAGPPQSHGRTGSATIVFVEDEGGGTIPGGGGGGGTDRDRGGNGGDSRRPGYPVPNFGGEETVSILDPDIPLADLGELPKTGGGALIPMMLVTCGAWLAWLALRPETDSIPITGGVTADSKRT